VRFLLSRRQKSHTFGGAGRRPAARAGGPAGGRGDSAAGLLRGSPCRWEVIVRKRSHVVARTAPGLGALAGLASFDLAP